MSSTIYPLLGTALMNKKEFQQFLKTSKVSRHIYDGEKFANEVIRGMGIKPINYDSYRRDSICIWNNQQHGLQEITLPDGSTGSVFIDDEEQTGIYLLHDNDKYFQLAGFSLKDSRITITYAAENDLVMYYHYKNNLNDKHCMGTVMTALLTNTTGGNENLHDAMNRTIAKEDLKYMRQTVSACNEQGFRFESIEFRRLVPVPVSIFQTN